MFRFIEKHFNPEKFYRPADVNNDALEDARLALVRTELVLEEHQYNAQCDAIKIEFLRKRIARLEAASSVVGAGL
jgi:hypothetical protein